MYGQSSVIYARLTLLRPYSKFVALWVFSSWPKTQQSLRKAISYQKGLCPYSKGLGLKISGVTVNML